jgi:hypothetical protein
MGAVGVGALLFGVLLVVVAVMVWEATRRSPVTEYAEYLIPEAAAFVFARLSDRAVASLDPETVRRILEWNLEYTQVVAPRAGAPAIIGSGDGLEFVLQRAAGSGLAVDPFDVAEVMTIETDYLLEIGAVGTEVGNEEES